MVEIPSSGGTDYMAPTFALEVEGQELDYNVMEFIESVEYESADGMADILRIRAINPDFLISNAKVFQPGNEVAVWMGYGTELEFVGRGLIRKQVPNFPQSGMPTIQAVAFTKDVLMMDNEPEKPKKEEGKKNKKGGRVFKDAKFSDAVYERPSYYGFAMDIDDTPDKSSEFIQRPGQSDYEFVNGLANLNGYVFWVEGDEGGNWKLYFKMPGSLQAFQKKKYTFIYNQQDDSTLLTFQPEFLINGAMTEMEVVVKDIRTGEIITTTVKEENDSSPDISAVGDVTGEVSTGDLLGSLIGAGSSEGVTTASDVKLFFNDFSFTVNSNRRFKTQAEVDNWAKQWFRRMRENFVLSRGRVIGVGNLRSRQTHRLEGVGDLYTGDYYFTKVKHICSKDQGYIVDFAARKVVP
jgi:phage protein D